jgi:hypothetical protein
MNDRETRPPTDSGGYGFPSRLWREMDRRPPPGLRQLQRWRSPLRGPWLTSVLGLVLLITLPVVIITGLLSYIAYGPQFGTAIPADVGWLKLPTFDWPTNPSWLYRLNQGSARRARAGTHPGSSGQTVVGDPETVRVATVAVDRASAGTDLAVDAGRRNSV